MSQTTGTGAKKIAGTDDWRTIFDIHNDTVDAYDGKIGTTALPTTAQTLTGAVAEHETDITTLNSKFENDKIEYTDRNKGPYYCLVDIWTTLIPADNKVHFIILKAQYGDCFGFISRYGNYGTAMLLRYDGKALFEFLDNGTIIEKQPVWA